MTGNSDKDKTTKDEELKYLSLSFAAIGLLSLAAGLAARGRTAIAIVLGAMGAVAFLAAYVVAYRDGEIHLKI